MKLTPSFLSGKPGTKNADTEGRTRHGLIMFLFMLLGAAITLLVLTLRPDLLTFNKERQVAAAQRIAPKNAAPARVLPPKKQKEKEVVPAKVAPPIVATPNELPTFEVVLNVVPWVPEMGDPAKLPPSRQLGPIVRKLKLAPTTQEITMLVQFKGIGHALAGKVVDINGEKVPLGAEFRDGSALAVKTKGQGRIVIERKLLPAETISVVVWPEKSGVRFTDPRPLNTMPGEWSSCIQSSTMPRACAGTYLHFVLAPAVRQ